MMTSDWRVGRGDASLWFVVVIVVMVMRIFMTVKLTTMYMIVVGHVVGDISCISVVTCMVFDHSYIHRPEFEPAHTHKYFQCKIILCIVFCLCPMLLDLFCPAPPPSPHITSYKQWWVTPTDWTCTSNISLPLISPSRPHKNQQTPNLSSLIYDDYNDYDDAGALDSPPPPS